jgi:hypothetical protein
MGGLFDTNDIKEQNPAAENEADLFEKRHVQILQKFEKIHEYERNYTTLVTSAGYAALLTVWNGAGPLISHSAKLSSGAFIGISILIFVVFEISKVSYYSKAGARYNVVIEKFIHEPSFDSEFRKAQLAAAEDFARISKFQRPQFFASLAAGILEAVLFLGNMLSMAFFHLGWPK